MHLASDVPLAVFLSGGVDSSVMANLAQRAAQSPIHTFTLAFEEQELNEGPIARRIAAAIGTQHHEVVLTEGHFVENLEAALDSLDQPTFDGLNAYYMSHAIRPPGSPWRCRGRAATSSSAVTPLFAICRCCSAGLDGGWVPRRLLVAAAKLATWPLRRSDGAVPPQTRWAKLPEMVRRGDDLLSLYQLAYALFLPGFQRELLAPGFAEALADGLPRRCASACPRRRGSVRRSRPSASWSSGSFWASACCATTTPRAWPRRSSSGCPWSTRSSSRASTGLPDQTRYRRWAKGHVAAYWPARIGPGAVRSAQERVRAAVRSLDPARPEGRMDETLRDPQAVAPAASTRQLWGGSGEPSWKGRPACIGRGSGRFTSSSDGAIATASFAELGHPLWAFPAIAVADFRRPDRKLHQRRAIAVAAGRWNRLTRWQRLCFGLTGDARSMPRWPRPPTLTPA